MSAQVHRLFFALRPDALVAERISHVAAAAADEGSVSGRWVKPPKYHLTVQFLGTHSGRPTRSIETARLAAAQVALAEFDLVLDRIDTFGGHRHAPCVLRCTADGDAAVQALRTVLAGALTAAGLAHLPDERFTPHVTIGYVGRQLPAPLAIAPIRWPVREFALIESQGGEARHDVLGHWRLLP